MTENEAIDVIHDKIETCEFYFAENDRYPNWCEYEFVEALGIAISAFKEVQQFREIGTVEECREAVENQKLKKPKELDTEYGYFICGNCGGAIACTDDFKNHKYCLNCGQAIDWEESEVE